MPDSPSVATHNRRRHIWLFLIMCGRAGRVHVWLKTRTQDFVEPVRVDKPARPAVDVSHLLSVQVMRPQRTHQRFMTHKSTSRRTYLKAEKLLATLESRRPEDGIVKTLRAHLSCPSTHGSRRIYASLVLDSSVIKPVNGLTSFVSSIEASMAAPPTRNGGPHGTFL